MSEEKKTEEDKSWFDGMTGKEFEKMMYQLLREADLSHWIPKEKRNADYPKAVSENKEKE